MKDLEARGICMFCPEHIHNEARGSILLETKYWMIKTNDFPYNDTKIHVLIIPKKHVTTLTELSTQAKSAFLKLIDDYARSQNLDFYALGMRVGDMRYNGGSISHLHAHLIVGNVNNINHESVRFKMSSRPKK